MAPCGADPTHSLGEVWTCSDGCSECKCDMFGAVTARGDGCGTAKPAAHAAEGGSEALIVQGALLIVGVLFAGFVIMLCYMCNKPQSIEHATCDDEESAVELSPTPRGKKPHKAARSGKASQAARAGWGKEPGGKSRGGGKSRR